MAKSTSTDVTLLKKLAAGELSPEQVTELGTRLEGEQSVRSLIELAGLPTEDLSRSLREKNLLASPEVRRLIEQILEIIDHRPERSINQETLDAPAGGPLPKGFGSEPSMVQSAGPFETAQGDSAISNLAAKISISTTNDDTVRFDSFVVEKELGHGGMGTVYLAKDVRLDRQVAIKTLKRELACQPAAVERFLREARSAAKLEHDHICPIYHVGESRGTPYIAMPFLKGEPLDAKIRREKLLSIPDVLRISREVALGLTVAHEAGLIHRDIKPANIWLETMRSGPPRVRILDFGLARTNNEEVNITASGAILGTPAYMAPEQARGDRVDARADYWSLGVMMYEMSTGKRPFTGNNTMAVLSSLALDNPAPPHVVDPSVPVKLSELIMRLLVKDPQNRPSNGQRIADQLRQLQREAMAAAAKPAAPVVAPMPNAQAIPPAALAVPARPDDTVPLDPFAGIDDVEPAPRKPLKKSLSGVRPAPAGKSAGVKIGGLPGWIKLLVPAIALFFLIAGTAVYKLVFETKNGTLIVEVDGDAEVRFKDGKVEVSDTAGKTKYLLSPGEKPKPMAAGKYQVRVIGADGVKLDTEEFSIERGGKTLVRVRAMAPAVAANGPKSEPKKEITNPLSPSADPDRKAAEYLLSVGGSVCLDGSDSSVKAVSELPKKRFRLTSVIIDKDCRIDEKGWVLFRYCVHLELIDLNKSNITDDSLKHFSNCKRVKNFSVIATKVTDAGLMHFNDFDSVRSLGIAQTSISDAGIENFRKCPIEFIQANGCKNITGTFLKNCDIQRDAKFELGGCPIDQNHLTALRQLERVGMLSTVGLGDEATDLLASINIGDLQLYESKISDKGLVTLGNSKNLKKLTVQSNVISKEGVTSLRKANKLRYLTLLSSALAPGDLAEFRKALPMCKVILNDQIFDPSPKNPEANRKAAEFAISSGGKVFVNSEGIEISAADKLPKKPFWLSGVRIQNNNQIKDADLSVFFNCEDIEEIDFVNSKNITATGLAHFRKCKNLFVFHLQEIPVTDEGLANFREFPNLHIANLFNAKITDAGLEHLSTCPSIRSLWLPNCLGLSDKGLALFKNHRLTAVNIDGPGISDASAGSLGHVESLALHQSQISIEGFRKMKSAKNLRHLTLTSNQNIDDRCVESILSQFAKLEDINISQCPVTDESLKLISRHSKLSSVILIKTKITDAGIEHLKSMTGLRYLDVKQTTVTEVKLKELHRALPWCTIHSDVGVMEPE